MKVGSWGSTYEESYVTDLVVFNLIDLVNLVLKNKVHITLATHLLLEMSLSRTLHLLHLHQERAGFLSRLHWLMGEPAVFR